MTTTGVLSTAPTLADVNADADAAKAAMMLISAAEKVLDKVARSGTDREFGDAINAFTATVRVECQTIFNYKDLEAAFEANR